LGTLQLSENYSISLAYPRLHATHVLHSLRTKLKVACVVDLDRSKTLAFLYSHKDRRISITREFAAFRSLWKKREVASDHQYSKTVYTDGRMSGNPKRETTPVQTPSAYGHWREM
jgi:hypothetical protein